MRLICPLERDGHPSYGRFSRQRTAYPFTLFEAADEVDSGPIYAQRWIEFEWHELVAELREGQARAVQEICHWFGDHYPDRLTKQENRKAEKAFTGVADQRIAN